MDYGIVSSLLGGIGLFLLGMHLMTNGLRLASGQALRTILERATQTTLHGVMTGVIITSMVQSSSAVTVATLGFVNAGLIHLRQAITVIYGSNIGTTMTAWLVALIGLNFNIKIFALPAIGIGMLMRLIWSEKRPGFIGEAITGFGLFFLGIEILKTGFEGMGTSVQFSNLSPAGVGLILLVISGFIITVLMQSSSAAMAIILTAAGGGVVPLDAAAVMVIGANVGTTSTALLAVIGATPNAKRAATAHVCFNLITGLVALLILPWLLSSIHSIQTDTGLVKDAPAVLALFHTVFNVLGVALLWPATGLLVRFLEQRFRSAEEDEAKPQFLDHTLISTPQLAFHALGQELSRIGSFSQRMAKGAISAELGPGMRMTADKQTIERLVMAVVEFSTEIQKSNIPAELAEALPNGLRVSRYYIAVAQLAESIASSQLKNKDISYTPLEQEITHFKRSVVHLIDQANAGIESYDSEACAELLAGLENRYQHLKSTLLKCGAAGQISVQELVNQLELMSHIRRLAEQIEKGARYLWNFNARTPADLLEERDSSTVNE